MTRWKWTLPQLLCKHLQDQDHWKTADHFGLLLDKFTPYAKYPEQRKGRRVVPQGYRLGPNDLKREWLDALVKANQKAVPQAAKNNRRRWEAMVQARGGGFERMITASPLIVGLGAGHVLETSITLDRNTGMPLIPGSALKGLARMVALIEVAESVLSNPRPEDLERFNEEIIKGATEFTKQKSEVSKQVVQTFHHFIDIFGTPESAGNIVFVDGVYADDQFPQYRLDIMTPHFPQYYGENQAPSDDQNPRPISYLTVGVEQLFLFGLLPRKQEYTSLLEKAWGWLEEGLTEFGIGAKTAQGCGLFERTKD